MIENDTCLGGTTKQNVLFKKNVPQKEHLYTQCLKQALVINFCSFLFAYFLFFNSTLIAFSFLFKSAMTRILHWHESHGNLLKSMDWFLYDNGPHHERVKCMIGCSAMN